MTSYWIIFPGALGRLLAHSVSALTAYHANRSHCACHAHEKALKLMRYFFIWETTAFGC